MHLQAPCSTMQINVRFLQGLIFYQSLLYVLSCSILSLKTHTRILNRRFGLPFLFYCLILPLSSLRRDLLYRHHCLKREEDPDETDRAFPIRITAWSSNGGQKQSRMEGLHYTLRERGKFQF